MTTPGPGWYAAPDGQPYERWWDGHAWGEQTRPQPQQPVPVAAAPARAVTYERVRTSHGLHLFLSIITGGLWAVCVWLPLTVWHSITRRRVVTRYR